MDGRPDQEEMDSDGASHQQIPAEVGEAREEGLQGPGRPTVTLAQGSRVPLSMSVAEAMEAGFLRPQVTNPGYPGLSQFIW